MANNDPENLNTNDNDNPFSQEPKNEFDSGYSNPNTVSQFFKGGNFFHENKSRIILFGVLLIALIGFGAFYYMTSSPDATSVNEAAVSEENAAPHEDLAAHMPNKTNLEEAGNTSAAAGDATHEPALHHSGDNGLLAGGPTHENHATKPGAATGSSPVDMKDQPHRNIVGDGGAPTLVSPKDGYARYYDESSARALFTWNGRGPSSIEFSRSKTMSPLAFRVNVEGNQYHFHRPYPGTWYWRVTNSEGESAVRKFIIYPPVQRQVIVTQPTAGSTVAGTGGLVSWQGDTRVSFYRVELSGDDTWASPKYRFATSGTALKLNGVTGGSYYMRIGAFSEVSGRWEYTAPVNITVQ